MVKAMFIDIDGTLRESNRNLSARTIATIRKAQESLKEYLKDCFVVNIKKKDMFGF